MMNRFDLYLPPMTHKSRPVVIFVTGGAWIIGYGSLFYLNYFCVAISLIDSFLCSIVRCDVNEATGTNVAGIRLGVHY